MNFLKKLDIILLSILIYLIFSAIIKYIPSTDFTGHVEMLLRYYEGKQTYPPNFIYYLLIDIFSFFSADRQMLLNSSCMVLTAAVVAKYIISKKIIYEYIDLNNLVFSQRVKDFMAISFSMSLIFLFAIPDYYNFYEFKMLYLGRVPPNVWHNSTTITVFPFALLLFWEQYKVIKSDQRIPNNKLIFLTLLIILNVFIKPSFLFVYIPVTGLFLLFKYRFSAFLQLIRNSLPLFVGALLILLLQILVYQLNAGLYQAESSKLVFVKPFQFWLFFLPEWYIPYSFLLSFAFPIVFLLLYPKKALGASIVQYGLALTILGLLISIFIGEDGPRSTHGNFIWQNYICIYILILTMGLSYIKTLSKKPISLIKAIALLSIYLFHLAAGIFYLINMINTGSYK
jgi:hypothetical protein